MTTTKKNSIKIEAKIKAPIEKVWQHWTDPNQIMKWNSASEDWHTTRAENDLREGGKFSYRMEARDGSVGFDFSGIYTKVETNKKIEFRLDDDRMVSITFLENAGETFVSETFEAEDTNPIDLQQSGWQSILNNFKKHVETADKMVKINFEVNIQAPVEKVYKKMIEDEGYRKWTAPFNPSSHFVGTWEKGAKILFIGTDKDGIKEGMVARIKENIPYKYISIEHVGLVKENEEITSGPQVDGWAGAHENYTFIKEGNNTIVKVDMDANVSYKSYMEETWPKALSVLKTISETN